MTALTPKMPITIAGNALPPLQLVDTGEALANTVRQLSECLEGPRLAIAVVAVGRIAADLTPGEMARYQRLASPERRQAWVAGRIAIKAARKRLGLSTDTSALRFPDACTSLTHAAGFAVAVAAPKGALRGLGVDLEARRITSSQIDRFFLTEDERDRLECRPAHLCCDDRIRLWTVKEAVYKAHPDNHGMSLKRIAVKDPAANRGLAVCCTATSPNSVMAKNSVRYASSWTPVGCISLAVMPASPNGSLKIRRWTSARASGACNDPEHCELGEQAV